MSQDRRLIVADESEFNSLAEIDTGNERRNRRANPTNAPRRIPHETRMTRSMISNPELSTVESSGRARDAAKVRQLTRMEVNPRETSRAGVNVGGLEPAFPPIVRRVPTI